MPVSTFLDKAAPPHPRAVTGALKLSKPLWDALRKHVQDCCKEPLEEWKYYSVKSGWTCVLKDRDRTLLYLSPQQGFFEALFVFGDKAVQTLETSKVAPEVLGGIRAARRYVEGRSYALPVRTAEDLETAKELLAAKLNPRKK